LAPEGTVELLLGLSVANPLLSQTVYDNITLANAGHKVRIEGESANAVDASIEEINNLALRLMPGGADTWFSVAFYQMLITGALSHEYVIKNDLKGIDKSKFVDTDTIRFIRSGSNDGRYIPVQTRRVDNVNVVLNTDTYHYRTLLQWSNSPYGIPPYFSIIEPTWIQRDVMKQVSCIAKKFGLLGLIEILLEAPQQNIEGGESDDDYRERLRKTLVDAQDQLQDKLQDGVMIGYKGAHEFSSTATAGNASGIPELWDRVDMQAHSAANNDPSLTGRNFSRTETQIKIIYQKTTRQLRTLQRVASRSLEEGYALHLLLAGLKTQVSIDFNRIDSFDAEQEETTFRTKIENERNLYDLGITNQEQMAQRLGFDTSDQEEPRRSSDAATADNSVGGAFECRNGIYRRVVDPIRVKLNRDTDLLVPGRTGNYASWVSEVDCDCEKRDPSNANYSPIDDKHNSLVAAVMNETAIAFDNASEAAETFLRSEHRRLTPEMLAEQVHEVMAREVEAHMGSTRVEALIDSGMGELYDESRLGAGWVAVLGVAAAGTRPVFDIVRDSRSRKFSADAAKLHVGRFIRDSGVAQRIKQNISNSYEAAGRVASNPAVSRAAATAIVAESFVAKRGIDATSAIASNHAYLRSLQQVGTVVTFTVDGPVGGNTCAECVDMVGRTFTVEREITRMENVIDAGPDSLSDTSRFLKGSLPFEDETFGASDADLQDSGFARPPYHPGCVHGIVASDVF
jgi:hypothetical protein